MRPGLAKIIEKVCISWYFESSETDLHMAENACGIDYTDTWSSKCVHWMSKSKSLHHSTSNHGCEDQVKLITSDAQTRLPIAWIHTGVAEKFKIQWLLATLHNSRWMDDCKVYHGSSEDIPILDPVDVKIAYSHIASCYHRVPWHVRSYGWCDAIFASEEYSMEGRLVLGGEVSSTGAVQILLWSDSNDRYPSHFCTDPWSFPEVVIV